MRQRPQILLKYRWATARRSAWFPPTSPPLPMRLLLPIRQRWQWFRCMMLSQPAALPQDSTGQWRATPSSRKKRSGCWITFTEIRKWLTFWTGVLKGSITNSQRTNMWHSLTEWIKTVILTTLILDSCSPINIYLMCGKGFPWMWESRSPNWTKRQRSPVLTDSPMTEPPWLMNLLLWTMWRVSI